MTQNDIYSQLDQYFLCQEKLKAAVYNRLSELNNDLIDLLKLVIFLAVEHLYEATFSEGAFAVQYIGDKKAALFYEGNPVCIYENDSLNWDISCDDSEGILTVFNVFYTLRDTVYEVTNVALTTAIDNMTKQINNI